MDIKSAKKNIARDTLLYFPAKMLEGLIGIAAFKVYGTFAPEIYGNYTIVNITVTITSLFLLGWLIQSVFRYINHFNSPLKLKVFYSTAFVNWGIVNGSVLILGSAAAVVTMLLVSAQAAMYVVLGILMILSYSTAQILFGLIAAIRRVKLNLLLSLSSISGKLILTVIFVHTLFPNAYSLIVSNIIMDSLTSVIIIFKLQLYKHIRPRFFSSRIFRKFWHYGVPLVGVSATMSFLAMSDRYVIRFWLGSSPLGVYAYNYSFASSFFTVLLPAIMRGVYPMILKTWKQSTKEHTEELLSQAVRYYLLAALPAVVGLSAVSSLMVRVLSSKPAYTEGSFVIVCVSVGMFFMGLTEYSNKAWELTSNTKPIFRFSLVAGITNVVLNVVFIPIWGYPVAAVTTALSYIIYFTLSISFSRKILKWHLPLISYVRIIGSALLMGLVVVVALPFVKASLLSILLMVVLGGVVYFLSLLLSREIRNEMGHISSLVKKKLLMSK